MIAASEDDGNGLISRQAAPRSQRASSRSNR
jgi:hypothetical protein